MKKRILLIALVVLGVAFLLAFSGCKYPVAEVNVPQTPVVKDSSIQLLAVPKQWKDIYGDSYQSQVNFNIAVLNARVNKLAVDVNTLNTKQILKNKGK